MAAFVFKRLIAMAWVLLVVALFVFMLLHLSPGDPAGVIAGEDATPEDIEQIRDALGLNEPLYVQLRIWFGNLLVGDFGNSVFSNRPVTELVAQRLEPTISLAVTTILFSVAVAVPMGTLAAWRANSLFDHAFSFVAVLGFSLPAFVIGYGLIYFFALKLDWLPVQGFVSIREGLLPFVESIIMPTIMLGTVYIVLIARITRASVLEVLGEDYVRTAHAKGVNELAILSRHVLKNASIPIVTVVGFGLALLVSGVVITETVFNIPGIGRLTVDAILKRDYPLIQGLILLVAAAYVIINTAIDILYAYLDPRIRY